MKLPLQISTILSNQSMVFTNNAGTHQAAVWITQSLGAKVALRNRATGVWTTFNLATIPGNPLNLPTPDDAHNGFVCAIDALGYIHVYGNMHAEAVWRYVRSANPLDVTSWVSGLQFEHPDTPVAGSMAYPATVQLSDGTLFQTRRYRPSPGEIGSLWASRLAPGAQNWENLGPIAQGTDLTNGDAPYANWHFVDENDRVHVHWTWSLVAQLSEPPVADSTYVYSDDLLTWHAVNGTVVKTPGGPPISRASGVPAKTGIVHPDMVYTGGLATDAQGRPHVTVAVNPDELHIWWDGAQWQSEEMVGSSGVLAGWNGVPMVVRVRGELWYLGTDPVPSGRRLTARHVTTGTKVKFCDVPSGWGPHYDQNALRLFGTVEMFVPDGDDAPRLFTFGGNARQRAMVAA